MMKIYDSSTASFLKATGLEHLQAPVLSIVGAEDSAWNFHDDPYVACE